jgi:hypothetical protein
MPQPGVHVGRIQGKRMVASLANLIIDWARRRAHLRRQAEDASLAWLCLIRIRILSFLLSRYDEPIPTPPRSPGSFAPPTTFCIVPEPADHPPRRAPLLGALLRRISQSNIDSRRRRFWP